jgi:AAA domain/DnaB-like helicase N terminal domain
MSREWAMPPPPWNQEAEEAVLGAILLRPAVFDQMVDVLDPQDFYRTAHGLIFRTIVDLWNKKEPIDVTTVTALLKERGQLDDIGGPDMPGGVFLAELSNHVGTAANAPYYAKLVWEKSQIRKVQAKAAQILKENPNGNLEEFLTWAESQIFEVTQPALNRANSFPPLDGTETPVSEYLVNPSPPRRYLFEEVLPAGIVGELVAMGGTGKGHLIIMLGLLLATSRKVGPLKPAREVKVVYLAAEDDQEELQRRTVSAIKTLFPDGTPPPEIDNFKPVSVVGKLGPLMQFNGANPENAAAYDWICKTLENLPGVEVLILDPKSKFYGLDENDNSHCAAWVNCLESLAARFKITILFSHHESKAKAGSMEQNSSRGGSALPDGCRWVANIKTMDPKTAEKFQVTEPHNFVVLDVTKSNYAPKLPAPIYFRRGAGGALTYVDLAAERVRVCAERLLERLSEEAAGGRHFSRRDLLYSKEAKHIIDGIKEMVPSFSRVRDINQAMDHLLEAGWLEEVKVKGVKTGPGKTILRVVATAD